MMSLHNQTTGHWPHIHSSLGINPGFLRNIHMPCPGCGGRDRWRYDDKDGRGTFYCGGGGDPISGDGFDLLCHVHGWDFKTAANEVRRVLGVTSSAYVKPDRVKPQPKVKPPEVSRTQPYAIALWEGCERDDAVVASHPYAIKKRINGAAGAGMSAASGRLIGRGADCLIVPQRTLEGVLIGVECINPKGVKQCFGKKGLLILGNDLDDTLPQLIVEGWATAVSVLNMYDWNGCVYTCFGKGMMTKLAIQVATKHPHRQVIIGDEQDG